MPRSRVVEIMIAICVVAGAWNVPQLYASEETPGYRSVQTAFLKEDFETVVLRATRFLTQHSGAPEAGRVWIWLALSNDKLKQPRVAIGKLEALRQRLNPSNPLAVEALFWQAEVSRRSHQMIKAKFLYQKLLEEHPKSTWKAQAQLGLGLVYVHQQAYEKAAAHFHDVVGQYDEKSPVALDALLYEGLCRLKLKKFSEALDVLRPLIVRLKDPASISQASFYAAESLSALGRHDEAIKAYRDAIESSSDSPWLPVAYFGIGWSQYQSGRCEESVKAFDSYLEYHEEKHRVEAWFAKGSCLVRLGRQDEALPLFERIVRSYPGHRLALESAFVLVDIYREQQRFAAARRILDRLARRYTDSSSKDRLRVRLGALALGEGRVRRAKNFFESAVSSDTLSAKQAAFVGLGDVEMFYGNIQSAKSYYEKGINISADTSLTNYAAYQLGRAELQLNELQDAIAQFRGLIGSSDKALADDARLALILAYLKDGNEQAMHRELNAVRLLANSETIARASYYEALLALSNGKETTAHLLAQQVVMHAPSSEEALEARLLIADMRQRRNSLEDAAAWLRKVYRSVDVPRNQRGRLAKHLGDYARMQRAYAIAIRWYDDAMQLAPVLTGEVIYQLASCYEEAGDIDLAIRRYQAIEQNPWRVRGRLAAAKLLERQQRLKAAQAVYESLADEPIPEAKVVRERLAALREHRKLSHRRN